jgi:hypothetical protein
MSVSHQQKGSLHSRKPKVHWYHSTPPVDGGSTLLVKGAVPKGTLGEMVFGTAFGKVNAHVEFLPTGADGVPLAQAFAFLAMIL